MDPDQVMQSFGDDPADGPALETAEPQETPEPLEGDASSTRAQRPPTTGQLRRERRRLDDERQELVYHLGGLALDLQSRAIPGDALVARRAEMVREIDARIASIDAQLADLDHRRRQRRVRVPPPAGYCLSCGAPYQTEAAFCFRCGARVHVPVDDADTQVIAMGEAAPVDGESTMVIPTTPVDER